MKNVLSTIVAALIAVSVADGVFADDMKSAFTTESPAVKASTAVAPQSEEVQAGINAAGEIEFNSKVKDPPPVITEGASIIVGDSITARWFRLSSDLTPIGWECAGVAGDTSVDILKRLPALIAQRPKRAILFFGVNNLIFHKRPRLMHDYAYIIEQFKAVSSKVYILSVLPTSDPHTNLNKPIDKENIDIKGLAEYYGIQFINVHPDFEQNGMGISSLYADGLHPNKNGYLIILNKILPIISE